MNTTLNFNLISFIFDKIDEEWCKIELTRSKKEKKDCMARIDFMQKCMFILTFPDQEFLRNNFKNVDELYAKSREEFDNNHYTKFLKDLKIDNYTLNQELFTRPFGN
jgi:hypothetical protein